MKAEITGGVRIDLHFDTPLSLRGYNGPDVDIAIQNREMGRVKFTITDHEKSFAVARTNINSVEVDRWGTATVNGTNRVEVKAPTSQHIVGVGTGGFAVKSSNREAYLLYSDPGGLSVYWFDVLDTKQNECALLIVPAPRPASEAALLSNAEKIRAIDRLEAAGLLGAGEARAKRALVMQAP